MPTTSLRLLIRVETPGSLIGNGQIDNSIVTTHEFIIILLNLYLL